MGEVLALPLVKFKTMEKIKIYRCPDDCSVGDTNDRCEKCGKFKLYAGMKEIEEVKKENQEISRYKF